ncbi:MAG: nucleotidyltransferase family protein [Clostridiales bacterium]|jgi:GTP:adenosylcobinamide-phosphate guanylyltransferase|nr:nucleotidyltransferase family protein [Clostridiales bacterium]
MIDVVVLAGTGKETPLTVGENVKNKAFIHINGRAMLSYTLDALRAVTAIDRIAVVGPVEQLSPLIDEYGILVVAEGGNITDNIDKGFAALQPKQHFLIVSADIPLLTPTSVEDFLAKCSPYSHDFYYPIVSKENSEKSYPGVTRTYARLREGTFTGGNLFLMNPGKLEESLPRLLRFFELRKSPLKLVSVLGFSFIVKLVSKRLSITEVEMRIPGLLGLSGKAVISSYPEIGTDVDKPSDLELMKKLLI